MLYEDYATTDPRVVERLSGLLNTPYSAATECARPRCDSSVQLSSPQMVSIEKDDPSKISLSDSSSSEGAHICQGSPSVQCGLCTKRVSKKFLALCVNTGRFHHTLGEIDVTNIRQDNETFRMIKDRYLEVRGFRARARRLFLFQPNSVHFVKVIYLKINFVLSWSLLLT